MISPARPLVLAFFTLACSAPVTPTSMPSTQPSTRESRLRADIDTLSLTIGERHLRRPGSLERTRAFLESSLTEAGYTVTALPYKVGPDTVYNLEATLPGNTQPKEVVVIGAHYDSVPNCPSANDNGSGVAGALELARALRQAKPARTIRFVFFVNEEPPYFQGPSMGSLVYAKLCRARNDNITAMICLETMAYFSDAPNSQRSPLPPGLSPAPVPTTGNFIGFVANPASGTLLEKSAAAFRAASDFPLQAHALPEVVAGVGYSDHWSFWQAGYPALMVTDTAMFRYPHYHQPSDTPDKLDFPRFTKLVDGLEKMTVALANN